MSEKRTRHPNYSPYEKMLLLNILAKYNYILQNKKLDHVTCKEKDSAWNKIAEEFNLSTTSIFRPVESLKKYYENHKKRTRKELANIEAGIKTDISNESVTIHTAFNHKNCINKLENSSSSKSTINSNSQESVDVKQESFELDSSSNSITSLSALTNDKNCSVRLNYNQLTSSITSKQELLNLYKEIALTKLALLKAQKEELQRKRKWEVEEYERKIKRDEEEHRLRMELLHMDIKIKKAQLDNT